MLRRMRRRDARIKISSACQCQTRLRTENLGDEQLPEGLFSNQGTDNTERTPFPFEQ